MIIGFDGSRAFSSNRTGTENYSYQLLKALSLIDIKNDYLIYLRPGSKVELKDWPKNFTFKDLTYKLLWTQVGLAEATFKDKLDILFVPAHTLPLIKRPGLKTVVTVHDLGSEYLPQYHQIKQRAYLSLMQNYQLQTATKIIAVSDATKEDLRKKIRIQSDKIKVIYEGYNSKLFNTNSDIELNRLRGFDLNPKGYFLFVGTIQPRKNLERLIRAFSEYLSASSGRKKPLGLPVASLGVGSVPDSKIESLNSGSSRTAQHFLTDSDFSALPKLVLVGKKGWLSDEIYELPKKLGIESQVKFLDYVKDEDLPSLYKGAIALVYPSLFEGFGLPILEAQACGCPVITSNLSSMPEVAGKGAILVDPYNIDDIVKGMKAIDSGQLRMDIVKKGFENVKKFSWEKCAKETLELLEDVTSR